MRKTITITLPIRAMPCPRPRSRGNGKGIYMPAKYIEYKKALRQIADYTLESCHGMTLDKVLQTIDIDTIDIEFWFKIPKSRLKKLNNGDPHRQKPDGDNLYKAVIDALVDNDEKIASGRFTKRWTNRDFIYITISGEVTE